MTRERERIIGAEKMNFVINSSWGIIAKTCKSKDETITNASTSEMMGEIQNMDEIINDLKFHIICC